VATYKEIQERVGTLDQPRDEFLHSGADGLHITFQYPSEKQGSWTALSNVLDVLERRNAVRGRDYIIVARAANLKGGQVFITEITVHTSEKWFSPEDMTCEYEETWK